MLGKPLVNLESNRLVKYREENDIKQLVYASAFVHRDMKHLGSLEDTQEARVRRSSPNFPRASYLVERTLTHEPIVKLYKLFQRFHCWVELIRNLKLLRAKRLDFNNCL